MKGLVVIFLLAMAGACATRALLLPSVVDEYPNVRVRIYRSGVRCRVEVITATNTIQTLAAPCVTVPHRVLP